MEAKDHNYGVAGDEVAEERGLGTGGKGPVAMGTQEEKTLSVLAHLSIFLNLVTGFLGPVAALIIWLVYRDRSSNVAFQALQSMWYQVAWLVILVAGWTVTTLLMIVLIGFLLVPVMALITLVPFVHGAYAAYRVSKDGGYRYPLIADMIEAR
ncbi:MAG: hypothetical protein AVDCRST_MAG58-1375 [uncultured Rubrobacteraceae bacterium]|uniref:DUF4870 domain-containing protein n=1 Tax=uncultured Rubrobacteraceae bacterium TaxID=349277 RepID=A0A6J4QXQ5_9ACTN|nr:MAG: hypothetical protein AVDCRST_MAG58-1375 [uncultured Rubrobacteraceae bacterium]